MKAQHEQLVVLEEKCRKMKLLVKDKKKIVKDSNQEKEEQPESVKYTLEDLESLQEQLKQAETEKQGEEAKLRMQISKQDQLIKQLQNELSHLTSQIKDKDQEYRSNELKIKELRRQLPQRLLKPIDAKFKQTIQLPPQIPKPNQSYLQGLMSQQQKQRKATEQLVVQEESEAKQSQGTMQEDNYDDEMLEGSQVMMSM